VRDFAGTVLNTPLVPGNVQGRVQGEALSGNEAEAGLAQMSRAYNEGGRELYIGVGWREPDQPRPPPGP